MKTIGIALGALVCAAATSAFAQSPPPPAPMNPPPPPLEPARDTDVLTAPVRAPAQALELGVEGGYTQGFGASTDPRVGAGAGAAVGASLDYRAHPRWSVGVSGQYQAYGSSANGTTLRGATADVHGTYHLAPYNRLDPYLTLGSGYRLFAQSPAGDAPTTLTHALELGKLELGLDVRPSEGVAISPVVGVDVNLFMWRGGGDLEMAPTANQTVNTFVFAGVKGRFDLGGERRSRPAP